MAKPSDSWQQHVINNVLPKMEARTGLQPAPAANPEPFSAGVHLQPSFDPIELLPLAAQDRLRLLRRRSTDAHLLVPPFEDVRQAGLRKIETENVVKNLTDHPQNFGHGLGPDDRRVIEATKVVERAAADLKRLQELHEVRTASWIAASGALATAEAWLRSGRPGGTTLLDHEAEPVKLAKGEAGLLDAIENRRRRVRELRADLHRLTSAPFPSSYAKQRAREQIEALAMQGAPSVSRLVELDGSIDFQTQRLTSEVHAERRSLAFTEVTDAVALVAWLHKDALIAALDREIATEADDKAALTHEQRQLAEAEVHGDLLAVERQEAALVFAAWEQGLACEQRSDISPLALLALKLVTVPRAPLPDSSPEIAGFNLIGGRR